ncbi:hypothetical protein [Streptomyces sp. NPDC046860]|uniref:hypothetical protein n=1 Tax=Streptomyces sp. NPDC046860 TaxID=3154495 RepID=UPI00340817F7
MVSAEIAQWMEQGGPAVTTAVSAYGAAVLTRTTDAAADSTVSAGQRILQAVWRRRDVAGRAELEQVVKEAVDEDSDAYTTAALSRILKQALQDDVELREERAGLLPAQAAGGVPITAASEHSIAAQHIGTAISGHVVLPPRMPCGRHSGRRRLREPRICRRPVCASGARRNWPGCAAP